MKKTIANELQVRRIRVLIDHRPFQGSNPRNICNRGATRKGAQLEITRDLRDDLEKIHLIAEAVQAAFTKIDAERHKNDTSK